MRVLIGAGHSRCYRGPDSLARPRTLVLSNICPVNVRPLRMRTAIDLH